MKTHRLMYRSIAALAIATAVAACSDMLGLDVAGNVKLDMAKTDSSPFSFPTSPDSGSQSRSVSPDTVSSFRVHVIAIEFLRAADDSTSGGWVRMQGNASGDINLVGLPQQSDSSTTVASGRLEAGTYTKVRLVVSNPRIAFKGTMGFGAGHTLQGGMDYAVELPGGSNTIEAGASLSVKAGTDNTVKLIFDQAASLGSVTIQGDGSLAIQTVLH